MKMLSLILAQYDFYGSPQSFFHGGMESSPYGTVSLIGLALLVITSLIGSLVQSGLMSAMKKYAATPAPMTGAEAAQRMLSDYGLRQVNITHVPGRLTDHFNPLDKTVNLSDSVYNQASVAAIAVAAHECGHAVQHARAYPWIGLRSALVPLVNIGSRLGQFILLIGLLLLAAGNGATVAWIGVALFGTTTLFALITLPVELDASRRALAWLQSSGLATGAMHGEASTALRWAAMTYVAAALSSLAMLLYYVFLIIGRSNRQ